MWMIVDRLYLGNVYDAEDLDSLRDKGITHVVNCARMPCFHEEHFTYLHLELDDPDPRLEEVLPAACQFIEEARHKGKVLVHCAAAVSRSPSVIMAYLCHKGMDLSSAWDLLLDRAPQVDPAVLFWNQLVERFGPRPPEET